MSVKYVEYLESTGDQHIPLKLDFTNNTRIVMDMMVKSTLNSYFLGNAPKGLNKIGNKIGFVGMTGTASNPSYGTLDVRTVMDYTLAGKLYFDGEEVHDFTNEHADYDTESPTYKVAVFGKDDNFEATGFRLYELKWYEGDELILHLKPCVDNGVGCLYDLVSETYYRCEKATYEPFILGRFIGALYLFANNNNATAENLGSYRLYNMKIEGDSEGVESGIDYVDYIYGDRTNDCKLDTGLPFTKSNKYVMGVNIIDSNSYSTFTGGFNYNWVTNRLGYGGLDVYPTWTKGGEGYFKNSWTTVGNEIVFDNGVLSVNGVPASNVNTPFDSDATGNNQVINLRYARLRYFRVYDKSGTLIQELLPCVDNEGISCVYDTVAKKYIHASNGTISHKKTLRDFQPVLDSNGIPTLMDKVNKKYYYDKNGKGFGYEESYKPVSYLQSDGKSYIDTNIIPTENIKIIVNGHFSQVKQYDTLFGGDGTKVQCAGNANQIYVYSGQSQHTYTYTNAVNIPHTYTLTHTQLKIDNDVLPLSSTGTIQNYSILLFGGWNKGVIEKNYLSQGKVYYFKIYQSDELVFDGIPVLDNEGTPCMYDLVTETFFYNQGTGEFSYRIEEEECPKANYVEYLKAPDVGNQIDTGITYDNTYSKIEFKFNTNNCNSSDEILRAGGDRNFWFWIYYGKIRFFNSDYYTFENGSNIDIDVTITSTECIINGTTYTYETPLNSVSQNMQLFSHSNWIKLYYFRVYDSEGNLIQDLHPSLDNDKIPCMYDTVSDSYFYSNGNDTFEHGKSIGYTPIKYIETNGTQYIDTGVVVNDNIYMDIDYRAVDKLHYIEDGLILRLDAIDNTRDGHNASSTVWEDLSGNGLDFNLTDVTVNDTTMTFNGTSSVGTLQNIELWRNIVNNTEQYTVEVCLKFSSGLSSYNPIISTNLGNVNVSSFVETIQVGQQSVGLLMKNNEYGGQLFFTISCDANDIIYHVNTKLRETLDKGDYIYPPTTDAFWIGARLTGSYFHFTGELCSIRIYNKKLTDEERLYNHSSDVIRYGVVTDVSVINTNRNYLMNDFYTDTTYKYKEINTTVEPNLTVNEGATLTLGSTYMSYLSEEELEQATKNGWIIE